MQELLSRLLAEPYNLGPLKQLERQNAAQIDALVAALYEQAESADGADAVARFLLEAGRLSATRLGDIDTGLQYIAAALEVGEETYVSLECHLFNLALRGEDTELIEYFTRVLEHSSEPVHQSRLYMRMGEILGEVLQDTAQAADAFTYAIELDAGNDAARWAYQDLARRNEDWPTLAELLYIEVEALEDPIEQSAASVELGRVYRDKLGDSEGAEQCFEVALQLNPDNAQARAELSGEPVDEAQHQEELDASEAAKDDDTADPGTMELGEDMLIEEEELGAVELDEEISESEYEAEEFDDPGTMELDDSLVIEDSLEVAHEAGGPPEVPAEGFAESEEEGEFLAQESEEFSLEEVASEAVEEAAEELAGEASVETSEIEILEEELADERSAAELDEADASEELQEEPEDAVGAADIEEVDADDSAQGSDWRERVDELVAQAESSGDEANIFLVRAARIESRHRQGDEVGLSLWDKAIELGVAGDFYRKTSYLWVDKPFWQAVYERVDDEGLKARIAFFDLLDASKSRAHAEAGEDEEILAALDDVDAASDNWRKFQRSVEQRHADLEGDEKARKVYWHMANMAAALDDLDKEVDALRRLDRQVDDPLVKNRLKVLYKRSEKWPMYVDLIKKEVEAMDDSRAIDKIDLLHEAIFVYREKMNHDMMVVNTYKEILDIDPENLEAIDALIEMYEKLNRASELINMLQEKAALVSTESAQVAIHEQIAELFLEKFRNQAEAIKAYEAILELRPHHLGAISFLKEMYEKRREWEKLIDVHKREIDTLETDAEKAEGFKEIAQLASDRLRDAEVATELWLEVRQLAPEDPAALDALETLYEKSRDYEKLADILEKKVHHLDSDEEKMKLFQKLGMLCADRLEDSERATRAWQQALELDRDDLKAKKALERLYIDEQNWEALEAFYAGYDAHQDLVRVLETLAGTVSEDDTKIELLLRAARIWRTVLEDTARAERDLDRALGIDERNESVALELEPIALEKEDYPRLKECYEIILSHRDEPEARREYQLKLAALHAEALEDSPGAFRWYAEAFREDPSAREVISPLEKAAENADVFETLSRDYADALDSDLDEETRQYLRLRLGRVLADELDELDEALVQFNAVLDAQEDNLEALAAVESIYRRAERWDELMSVYRRRLALTDATDDQVQILQGMAVIAERQAGDTDVAVERLREALELDEQNEETLQELHRLYAADQAWAELADIIRQEIEIIEGRAAARLVSRPSLVDAQAFIEGLAPVMADGPEEPELHAEAAQTAHALAEVALEEAEGDAGLQEVAAQEAEDYQAGLVEEASEAALEAISEVESAVEAEQESNLVAGYLEEEIERLVELRFELGVVCKEELGEDAEAVSALGEVLASRPLYHAAVEALEDYLEQGDFRDEVAHILAPVYRVQGQWNNYIRALQAQIDGAETPQQVEILEQIGRTQLEELAHHSEAFETYQRLLKLQPENERARAQLRRVAGPVDGWHSFISILEGELDGLDTDELKIAYLFDLAEAYFQRVDDSDTAQKYYHQVLEIRPDSTRALDELERVYAKTEQWESLIGVYEAELELADGRDEAEALKFKIALVHEHLLEQPERAIEVLVEMLEERPDNLRALGMLAEIYRDLGRWEDLAGAIEDELELVEGEAYLDAKNRLAAVNDEYLQAHDRAVDLYEEVLNEDPLNADATAALEQIMGRDEAPAARASLILEPLYTEREEHENLIHALQVQVQQSDDQAARVALRHRVASLQEEASARVDDAFITYGEALGDGVENEQTLENLYRLAEQQDAWQSLATLFEDEADAQIEPKIKYDLLWRAARICIDPLDERRQASSLLRQAQQLFPDDLETLDALDAQYRELQDYEQLVDVLISRAELLEEVADKKNTLYQAALIYEDVLDRPEDAVDVYRAVLEVDEADTHAIDRLEVILANLERWHELLEIYRLKLDLAESPEAKKDLLYTMGPIYREHLDEPFEAIETYRAILEVDPEELAALEKLDELYAETEQWNELLETLAQETELVARPEDKLDLRLRSGRLWESELGDSLRAIELYQGILAEDPAHEATTQALEDMISRGEQESAAGEVLQPIYEASGQWEKLIHVYNLLIESSMDPERKLELYAEVARIYEAELGDQPSAFEAHVGALGVNANQSDALEHLERLAADLGAWDILIEELDAASLESNDPDAVSELNLRIARIYEEELQDHDSAIERFNNVLNIDPEHQAAIVALDRLYQQAGQWDNLAKILQTRIYVSEEPAQVLDLQLRLGLVYREALDQPDEAIDIYQNILVEEPDNPQTIESLEQMFMSGQEIQKISDILEPHYLAKGQHEKLVDIYLQRLQMLDDPIQRHEVLMQIARIYLHELDDEASALNIYGAALAEKPDDPEVLARIEELAESSNGWGDAAGFLVDALQSEHLNPEDALSLWLSLARVLDEKLESPEDAENAYLEALELDPSEPSALSALDRIYAEQGRHSELAHILRRRLDATYDDEELVDLSFRLADIYQHHLQEPQLAVDTFERVLDIQPTHDESLKRLERLHLEHQQWHELFDVLQRQADNTHEPELKLELFARMAQLSEEMLDRPEVAIDLWNEVLTVDPTDMSALSELQRLYLDEERFDDLVNVLQQQVELTDSEEEQLLLYESLGVIWQDRLDNELQAHDAWKSALSIHPMYLPALESLREIYTRQADYVELAEILTRLLRHDQVDSDQKLALWIELAEVQGDMLLESGEAIEAWKNVMALDPGNELALQNLERLYLQEGMWAEGAQVLEIKVDQSDDEFERIELLNQIAEIWEQRMAEPNRAAHFYQQILDIDPTNVEAGQALENIYTGQDNPAAFQSLVELYLTRAELVDTDAISRADTLREAARIFEVHLEQPESALLVMLSAFVPETLDDEDLGRDLERLAEQTDQWGELVGRASDVLSELDEGLDAADLRRKIGYWYADKLDQPDDAVYHLHRALSIEPDNVEILDKLQDLYQQIAAWDEMADIMRQRIGLTSIPDERIELWRRLGELSEMQMSDVDQAVEAYREILALDEADLLAMESLERIFSAYDRPEELIEVLRQKANATYDPDSIVAIKWQVAELYDHTLQQPYEAIDAYREVLAVDQAHEESLQALERLYLQTEQWAEMLDVNEQALALAHEPEAQVAIYGKMAAVYEEQFDNPDNAIDAYNNILMVNPENIGAIENLERLYRGGERWFDLVETLSRHVEITSVDADRVELLNELAAVRRDQLDDPHGAIEALIESVKTDPRQAPAYMDLAGLQEQTDNYEQAVESYERLASLVTDSDERGEIYARIGEILEHQMLDDQRAEESYMSTLELMPCHPEALDALRRIADRKQDWQQLIRVLKLAEQAARDLDTKSEYLAEIGVLYDKNVGDKVSALNYYESALENNSRAVIAAQGLIPMYIREQKWERAVPLLELVISEFERVDTEPEVLHQLHLQAGQTFVRLEQHEKALEHYREAYEYDSDDYQTLRGLGDLLYRREDYEKAIAVFDSLEFQHIDQLQPEEMVELYYRMGSIRRAYGESRRATEYFIKALDIDGYNHRVLTDLIEIYEQQENWSQVADYTRRLLDSEEDHAARFALLTKLGELLAKKVGDTNQAVLVYLEALEIEPESMAILRSLLDLYTNSKQWIEAVDILDRLAEHERDAGRASRYSYAVGVIFRDEIKDSEEAIKYFDAALDQDIKMLKAFEAIDRILTDAREWKALEQAYRRMLHRISEQDDGSMEAIKLLLWTSLGEIYRSRLGHVKSAIGAYNVAANLNPKDAGLRLILAELYEKKADDPQGAALQHKELIKIDPFRTDSYRALFKAYSQNKEFDKAWCMAAALSYLQRANETEERFFRQYLGQNLPAAKGQLRRETMSLLYHPKQDMLISAIMNVLGQGLRGFYSRRIRDWNVHPRKDKLDLQGPTLFNKVYGYVARAQALVPAPEVYLRRDAALGIRNANADPPAVIAGADMMQGRSDRELAFMIGKQLCWMRPEHYLGSAGFPTENLKLMFMAAMDVTNPQMGIAQTLGEPGANVIREIRSLPPNALTPLRSAVKQFLEQNKNPNLSEWMIDVENTANRMGLLLCGDLHVAASCITNDPNPLGKATIKERIQELVLFAISDEYFELRKALGLAIG